SSSPPEGRQSHVAVVPAKRARVARASDKSAFTRVFDALWPGPSIPEADDRSQRRPCDPTTCVATGFRLFARRATSPAPSPGMTTADVSGHNAIAGNVLHQRHQVR